MVGINLCCEELIRHFFSSIKYSLVRLRNPNIVGHAVQVDVVELTHQLGRLDGGAKPQRAHAQTERGEDPGNSVI